MIFDDAEAGYIAYRHDGSRSFRARTGLRMIGMTVHVSYRGSGPIRRRGFASQAVPPAKRQMSHYGLRCCGPNAGPSVFTNLLQLINMARLFGPVYHENLNATAAFLSHSRCCYG